jgi:hypothetical protein
VGTVQRIREIYKIDGTEIIIKQLNTIIQNKFREEN